METNRITEIGERVIVHCQETKEELEKYRLLCLSRGGPEEFLAHTARITTRLQTQIARDTALLCAEEIVSVAESVVRSIPRAVGNPNPS